MINTLDGLPVILLNGRNPVDLSLLFGMLEGVDVVMVGWVMTNIYLEKFAIARHVRTIQIQDFLWNRRHELRVQNSLFIGVGQAWLDMMSVVFLK